MIRKLIVFLSLAVVFVIVALFYIYSDRRGETPSFLLEKIEHGSLVSTVSSSGTLSPVITVLVGSQASGQIKEILVDFNSEVREGQIIARIDPEGFEARKRQTEAELAVSRANVAIQRAAVARARAELENMRAAHLAAKAQTDKAVAALKEAKRDLGRKQKLHSTRIISESDIDKARAVFEQARAQLSAVRAGQEAQVSVVHSREAALKMAEGQVAHALAQVKQREAALYQSKIDLAHTIIRSPVNGVVIERNVDVGQTVAASLQAPILFTIAKDLRKMQVETSVDEADIGRLRLGQVATFSVDAFPGREFRGLIEQIRKAPHTLQNVVTYTVVVNAENHDLQLLPGMTANVNIAVDERADVLKVPNAALRFRPSGVKTVIGGNSGGSNRHASAPKGRGDAGERMNRLIKALDLDENQQAQVRLMFVDAKEKVREMRQRGAAPDEIRAKVMNIREKGRRAIHAILNQDQRRKFAQLSKTRARNPARPGRIWIKDDEGKASPVQVMTGISDGSFTEILRGDLKPGQKVIIGIDRSSTRAKGRKKFGF